MLSSIRGTSSASFLYTENLERADFLNCKVRRNEEDPEVIPLELRSFCSLMFVVKRIGGVASSGYRKVLCIDRSPSCFAIGKPFVTS